MDITTRPRPLIDKAKSVGGLVSAATGLITWAGTFGLLTVTQTAATSAFLALLPGIVAASLSVIGAFGLARSAEPLVTPMSDPRSDEGYPLTVEQPHG